MSSSNRPPIVNEYEREGRKVVWIYLNTASRMSVGSSVDNSLEYAVRAVLELTELYLSRECVVGFAVFNDGYETGEEPLSFFYRKRLALSESKPNENTENMPYEIDQAKPVSTNSDIILPDSGKEQYLKILRRLLTAKISSNRSSLAEVIWRSRRSIVGTSPLFIVLSVVDENSERTLLNGLAEMKKFSRRSSRRVANAMIIHIPCYEFTNSDEVSVGLRTLEDRVIVERVRGQGAVVVSWDPGKQRLTSALMSQVNRR